MNIKIEPVKMTDGSEAQDVVLTQGNNRIRLAAISEQDALQFVEIVKLLTLSNTLEEVVLD